MRKLLITLAAVSAGLLLVTAGQARSTAGHAVAVKTVTVAMHDPGCHWFSVGAAYKKTMSVKGPVALLNLDEAALKIVGRTGVKHIAVGKKIVLTLGWYRITMVGQAADDNTLTLLVK
jgi:hypothetical protein